MAEDANFCPACGHRRSLVRTNYRVGTGSPQVFAATLSSAGEVFRTGSLTTVLYDQFNQPGTNGDDLAMLREVRNIFVNQVALIPETIFQKAREGDVALTALRQKNERQTRAQEIVVNIMTTNALFLEKRSARLFRQDQLDLVGELYGDCTDRPQFVTKLNGLASLFEVERAPLQNLVSNPDNFGTITLVRDWLDLEGIIPPIGMIETWEMIVLLRNQSPNHPRTDGLVAAVSFFGEAFPVESYSRLWDKILDRFLSSLFDFQRMLNALQPRVSNTQQPN